MHAIDAEVQTWFERPKEEPWERDLHAAEDSYVARCRLVRFAVKHHGFAFRPFCDAVWSPMTEEPLSETGAMLCLALLDWLSNYGNDSAGNAPIGSHIYRQYLPDVNRPHPEWRTQNLAPPDVRIAPTLDWLREKLAADINHMSETTFRQIVNRTAIVAFTIAGVEMRFLGEDFAGDRPESAAPWRCLTAALPALHDEMIAFAMAETPLAGLQSRNVFVLDAALDFLIQAYLIDEAWTEKIIIRALEKIIDPVLTGGIEKRIWAAAGRRLPENLRIRWKSLFE